MYVYAGIDEAGYGPFFGPLVVGRFVLAVPSLHHMQPHPPQLWQRLSKAVCRDLTGREGRIAVNDSKKIHTQASGVTHLERGVLAFAAMAGVEPADLSQLLDAVGETSHRDLARTPWYAPTPEHPWQPIPSACTAGEIAVARSLLATTAHRIGVRTVDLGAHVVLEDRFNEILSHTRSKASLSFTHVASHMTHVFTTLGRYHPTVAVDRQSGRSRYRELLALTFPDAAITVLEENEILSAYRITAKHTAPDAPRPLGDPDDDAPPSMTVSFQVDSEQDHMPVALASMLSKYTREMMMARFQAWFAARAPHIKPTAGYGSDAKRFWLEIQPLLPKLGIDPAHFKRNA